MIELAMAEAYRPRTKKSSANLDANGLPSAPGNSPPLSSNNAPKSAKGFLSFKKKKRKQPSLLSNDSNTSSLPKSQPASLMAPHKDEGEEEGREILAPTQLPELPPEEPLPQEETDDYESALQVAIEELQNDFTSGARELAGASLSHLAHITDIAACMATSWGEFWAMMVHAAKKLSYARPSMSAAVTSCLLRALERIARKWNEEQAKGSQSTSELARIAGGTFDEIRRERRGLSKLLGQSFTDWLHQYCSEVLPHSLDLDTIVRADVPQHISAKTAVRIITLSHSSTIRNAVLHALSTLPDVFIHLTVLESRPRCEGADMAAQIYASASDKKRLSIQVIPDCAVATVVHNIDVVLLGADRISAAGDVSNKIGSLATVLCAKHLQKSIVVVAVSDVDKIAAPGQNSEKIESHPSSELTYAWSAATRNQLEGKSNVEILGEWFEWVPAEFIDVYVTELGIFNTEDVERAAQEIAELDEYIFQQKKG